VEGVVFMFYFLTDILFDEYLSSYPNVIIFINTKYFL
jgi:hypothetical protein